MSLSDLRFILWPLKACSALDTINLKAGYEFGILLVWIYTDKLERFGILLTANILFEFFKHALA